jgi:hypothetical protein
LHNLHLFLYHTSFETRIKMQSASKIGAQNSERNLSQELYCYYLWNYAALDLS